MAGKTILIVGGGTGGLVATNEARRRLDREHRVMLVDQSPHHLFSPSLPWVMAGWRRPDRVTKDLRRMVPPGVDVIRAQVKGIEPAKQRVVTDSQELGYDYLVVALGADLAPGAVEGFGGTAHNFFTLDGATELARTLRNFAGGQVVVLVCGLPYKCPAAPYEAALLLNHVLRRRGTSRAVDLQVYTPENLPMPVAGPVLGNAVKKMLEDKGIGFHPGVQVTAIDGQARKVMFKDGSSAPFDLLVAVPPHRPPEALGGSGLTDEAGWVSVDRHTMRTGFDNVYAVGDATRIVLPNGKPLPKAGVFAHAQAGVVVRRIAADVAGSGSDAAYDGLGYCWIEAGNGVAGFATGNFYAEPDPVVELRRPGRLWHWGKVIFESYWLGDGLTRAGSRWAMSMGSKLLGIPASF